MAENDGQPFDINLPPAHQYLHLREENLLTNADKYEDANVIINVSFLDLSIVLLPTQKFPYFTQAPLQISQFREAANSNSLIALQPIVRERTTNIATLIQISKFEELNDGVIIEAVGRQRCKVINRTRAINGMPYGSVLVLEDRELLPFSQLFVPSSCTRLPPKEALRCFCAMTPHSQLAVGNCLTETIVKRLTEIIKNWTSDDQINRARDQGLIPFSYWIASNFPIDLERRLLLLEESSANRRLSLLWSMVKNFNYISCKACSTPLASTSDLINLSSEGNSAHYVNPGGYVHDLLTVSSVTRTVPEGRPSSAFSWFPGYQWTTHRCDSCMEHIGWEFTSNELLPRRFFGLTRGSIRVDYASPSPA